MDYYSFSYHPMKWTQMNEHNTFRKQKFKKLVDSTTIQSFSSRTRTTISHSFILHVLKWKREIYTDELAVYAVCLFLFCPILNPGPRTCPKVRETHLSLEKKKKNYYEILYDDAIAVSNLGCPSDNEKSMVILIF